MQGEDLPDELEHITVKTRLICVILGKMGGGAVRHFISIVHMIV
jgi:hypothetical protein